MIERMNPICFRFLFTIREQGFGLSFFIYTLVGVQWHQYLVVLLHNPGDLNDLQQLLILTRYTIYIQIYKLTLWYGIMLVHSNIAIYIYIYISILGYFSSIGLLFKYWFTFQIILCFHYFCDFQKMVLDPNKPFINKFQIMLSNVCLQSTLSSSVAHLQPTPAFIEA